MRKLSGEDVWMFAMVFLSGFIMNAGLHYIARGEWLIGVFELLGGVVLFYVQVMKYRERSDVVVKIR